MANDGRLEGNDRSAVPPRIGYLFAQDEGVGRPPLLKLFLNLLEPASNRSSCCCWATTRHLLRKIDQSDQSITHDNRASSSTGLFARYSL